MGSNKKKKQSKGEGSGGGGGVIAEEGNQMINDPRFSSAHTDPRFRSMPRRQSKIAIDSRFKPMFSDKRFTTANAPVDKRGKRRKAGKGNDLLRDFYRLDEEDTDDAKKKKKKEKEKEESGDESENEMTDLKSEAESEEASDTDKKLKEASLDEESNDEADSDEEAESDEVSEEEVEEEEDDTDEDDEGIYEDDGLEIPEENIPTIPEETPRLAIVNMDWKHVSAKDLYVVLNSFLPKDGRILSVAVYPSEFGLQRMKEEEIHGPLIDGDKKKEDGDDDDEDEEEEDEDVINQKLRVYELSRLKYYFAVAECDSSATADYLYKSCDGIEFERSSNKLDLRFIPDSMEFKHPPRDIASEAPAGYEGLDFQSRALQLSKVHLSWDDDEPHRVKTLKQNFNSEQLADLEMKEFLASDESESDEDDDEDSNEGMNRKKVEKSTDKYRALIAEDVDSDKDAEEENDQDMEVTFNTGLEDLSKEILKKKDKKSESVWESSLRQRREKKRARKNKQNDDDDDDDYIDRKAVKDDDGDDDFFMEEPPLKKKKKKEGKTNKKKKGVEEEVAADESSRAELELLLADENAGDGNEPKGFNIKRKGKRGKTDISEEKIPAADLDDPRFSALLTSPAFALDPTDPQFKRSATYARQLAAKRKEVWKSHEDVKETAPKEKEQELNTMMGSKKERHSLNSTVKSLKMKMINKESEKKQAGNAVTSSTLAQRIKKKAKDLSKK